MDQVEKEVVKSGVTWLEYSVGRVNGKLDIWVKALPEVEKFFREFSKGSYDPVDIYDREWFGFNKDFPLTVYKMDKDPSPGSTYSLFRPASVMISPRDAKFNLSFLRLVGISSPEGLRFGIQGPCSKSYVENIADLIKKESGKFLYDFVVPVQINLRISSSEV